jgi:hypothetical protein
VIIYCLHIACYRLPKYHPSMPKTTYLLLRVILPGDIAGIIARLEHLYFLQ